MEFDDIVEKKTEYHRGYGQSNYHQDNGYRQNSYPTYHRNYAHNKWLFILLKYRTSRTIRIFTKIAAVAVIAIIVLVIVVLFPMIMKLALYISQNGLQGVVDSITVFLDKLWEVLGK